MKGTGSNDCNATQCNNQWTMNRDQKMQATQASESDVNTTQMNREHAWTLNEVHIMCYRVMQVSTK